MCRRFDTIPACDRRTDRRTDGIAVANTALAVIARAVNNDLIYLLHNITVNNDINKITIITSAIIFTARRSYSSAVLGVVILSVRLSVCLSARPSVKNACFVTNTKNLPAIFFIPHERAILLVFCHLTVVGGRRPHPPKMGDRSAPLLQKSLTLTDFRL